MKTLVRFLDADLINDIVYLMVGIKQVEITGQEYRELCSYANDWRSGLEKKKQTFKFIENNAMRIEGFAMARNIKRIINK